MAKIKATPATVAMMTTIVAPDIVQESASYFPCVGAKMEHDEHTPSSCTASGAHMHSDCEICACACVVIPPGQVIQEEFAVPGWKLPCAHGEQCSVKFSPVEK